MPFLGIEPPDTGMSVFTVLTGKNKKREGGCALKNGQKRSDMIVSGWASDERGNKNKYQQITEKTLKFHIYGVH
jgi:hypothetical protein